MWTEWRIPVPGTFRDDVAYLDIETRKVPSGHLMANGEVLRRRWQAFLVGVARNGQIRLVEQSADEATFLHGVRRAIGSADEVVYEATREFDEMVLKGRFTNARRAHETVPFYPRLPDAESLRWRNAGAGNRNHHRLAGIRADDIPSVDAPRGYDDGRYELVMIHLLRDVAELIACYGDPDSVCRAWCHRVLSDTDFAREEIFTGDE